MLDLIHTIYVECTLTAYIFGGPTPSCKPCFGLSANHVNIMQSPPSLSLHGVHTLSQCPMPLQESSKHIAQLGIGVCAQLGSGGKSLRL